MQLLIKIYFLIAFLNSLWCVWFWHIPESYIWGIYALGFLLILFGANKSIVFTKHTLISILMLLCVVFVYSKGRGLNSFGYIGSIFRVLPIIGFLLLNEDFKYGIYLFLRSSFVWICGVSLFFWLLHQLGIQFLPSHNDYFLVLDGELEYPIENHRFYTISLSTRSDDFGTFPRFCALFLEPGFLCCLISLMLFIDGYRFDRLSDKILYVVAFFTFSLAGWILIVLGILLYVIRNSKRRVESILLSSVLFLSIYIYGVSYNNGDNVVSKRIFDRLEYDEEEENISGYNRTSKGFDNWFSDVFIKSGDVYFGNNNLYETNFSNSRSVGWKVFVAKFGFVSLFIYMLFLYALSRKRENKYLDYCLLLLMLLIFARGHGIFLAFAFIGTLNVGFIILSKNDEFKELDKIQIE